MVEAATSQYTIHQEEHDKVYSEFTARYPAAILTCLYLRGFTISLLEHEPTVPTLWDSVTGMHPTMRRP